MLITLKQLCYRHLYTKETIINHPYKHEITLLIIDKITIEMLSENIINQITRDNPIINDYILSSSKNINKAQIIYNIANKLDVYEFNRRLDVIGFNKNYFTNIEQQFFLSRHGQYLKNEDNVIFRLHYRTFNNQNSWNSGYNQLYNATCFSQIRFLAQMDNITLTIGNYIVTATNSSSKKYFH